MRAQNEEFKVVLPLSGDYVLRSELNEATGQEEEWLYVEGIASDTNWDRKRGKVYPDAIRAMVETVNGSRRTPLFPNEKMARSASIVGVDVDHSNRWNDQVGEVVEAKTVERADGIAMWIKRRVDLGMSAGRDLKRALDKGAKLGWSIYGIVSKGYKDGEGREHFQQIDLKKIAITAAPVNAGTSLQRALSRSMNRTDMNEETQEQEVVAAETALPEQTAQPDNAEVARSEEAAGAGQEGGTTEVAEAAGTTDPSETVARSEATAPAPTFGDLYRAFAAQLNGVVGDAELAALDAVADQVMRGHAVETPASEGEAAETPEPAVEQVERSEEADVQVERAEVPASASESVDSRASPDARVVRAEATPQETEVSTDTPVRLVRSDLEGYILRAEVDAQFAEVKEILRGLPDLLSEKDQEIAQLREQLEQLPVLRAESDTLRDHVNKLTRVVNELSGASQGRTPAVARSFAEENAETSSAPAQVWADLPPAERARRYRILAERGQRDLAAKIMAGLADEKDVAHLDFSQLSPAAKAQIAGK